MDTGDVMLSGALNWESEGLPLSTLHLFANIYRVPSKYTATCLLDIEGMQRKSSDKWTFLSENLQPGQREKQL